MPLDKFPLLLEQLAGYDRVIVQTHDFPDHDAVASAYALGYLLAACGLNPVLAYNGDIDRISLQKMIDGLTIPIEHIDQLQLQLRAQDKIIVVDGCVGESNVSQRPGREVAVIDHHRVSVPGHLWYADVRSDYGATSTILVEYFDHLAISIPRDIATALLIGLTMDTANYTRGMSPADTLALNRLHPLADMALVGQVCRNQIVFSELQHYKELLDGLQIEGNVAFAMMPQGCHKNMLGILSDFVLSVDEVDVVILAAKRAAGIQLSLRSGSVDINAEQLLKRTLNTTGIGFGGGHAHMAGGMIAAPYHEQYQDDVCALYALFKSHMVIPLSDIAAAQ